MSNNLHNKTYSNSIILTRVADGESAGSFIVESNYDEILKFNTETAIVFSPEYVSFCLRDLSDFSTIQHFSEWDLGFLTQSGDFVRITGIDNKEKIGILSCFFCYNEAVTIDLTDNEFISRLVSLKDITDFSDWKTQTLYFNINELYESLSGTSDEQLVYLRQVIEEGTVTFRFAIKKNQYEIVKYLALKNGVSANMAKLHIGANDIMASVLEASLRFSAKGLEIDNGDFIIYNPTYKQESISPDTDFALKEYYILNSNNKYTKAYSYDPNAIYFSKTSSPLLYTDKSTGRLVFNGDVYAQNGLFRGEIHAETGSFNGSITATDGVIGGFIISSANYVPIEKYNPNSYNYILIDEAKKKYLLVENNSVIGKYCQITYSDAIAESGYFSEYYLLNSNQQVSSPTTGEKYRGVINESKISTYYKDLGGQLTSRDKGIILDAGQEKIIAKNIELGEGAFVADKVALGTEGGIACMLYNPSKHKISETLGGKVLEAANLLLTSNGYIRAGRMEIFGGSDENSLDGYIRSFNIDSNSQTQTGWWCIKEDGTSSFDTIYANNAHIQNSVLEIKTVQSVGSTMVFKEAWTIKKIDTTSSGVQYYLDNLANLMVNDYVMINSKVYKIKSVAKDETDQVSIIQFYNNNEVFSPEQIVMKIGSGAPTDKIEYIKAKETSRVPGRQYYIYDNGYSLWENVELDSDKDFYYRRTLPSCDCVISIQGGSSNSNFDTGVSSFSSSNSLCFSSFENIGTEASPKLSYTKHLIIGRLNESGIDELDNINGYGVYADNVYLNGSLTTRDLENGYAGINTLAGVQFLGDEYGVEDDSNIVFWGGAENNTVEGIQQAPFQVTTKGTLYAKNAIIEKSVIVGGTLSATTIKTASIYGEQDGVGAALSIYSADKGIVFKKDSNTEVFSIGTAGLKKQQSDSEKYFIDVTKSNVLFLGDFESSTGEYTTKHSGQGVSFFKSQKELGKIYQVDSQGNSGLELSIEESQEPQIKFYLTDTIFSTEANFKTNTSYGLKGDGTYTMQFKKVENEGYDIYIY